MILTDGHLDSSVAKTAHGLLRYSRRFDILGVIDPRFCSKTTDQVVPNCHKKPIYKGIKQALEEVGEADILVVGVATIGGYLPDSFKKHIKDAICEGMDVIAGLHKYLNDDEELSKLAKKHGVKLHDIRRPPPLEEMHYFMNRKKEIDALVIPFMGTDSSIGKRTALISVFECMKERNIKVEWVATGQTGLLQGAAHGLPLDSIKGDYMVGELEYKIWSTWEESKPDVILVEGQGSISHPAYVCGSRAVLAASQPDGVVLVHAPARRYRHYREDDIRWPMPEVETERQLIKLYSGADTIALCVNPEYIPESERLSVEKKLESEHGIPCANALERPEKIANAMEGLLKRH